MFRDSLQKRLQAMERENPSPSLETVKPTLRERVGFLGRYLSRAVEQVPQRSSIYDSLDDKANDYKLAMEYAGNTSDALKWLNISVDKARSGEVLRDVNIAIDIARDYAREAGKNLDNQELQRIRETYQDGIRTYGPAKAKKWLSIAGERLERPINTSKSYK